MDRLVAVKRYELAARSPGIHHDHAHLPHAAVHSGGEPGRSAADDQDFVQPPSREDSIANLTVKGTSGAVKRSARGSSATPGPSLTLRVPRL